MRNQLAWPCPKVTESSYQQQKLWFYGLDYFLAGLSDFLQSCRHRKVARQPAETVFPKCLPITLPRPNKTSSITKLCKASQN